VKLLALDTATEWCSVAIWRDGEFLSREARAERGHGGHVLTLIDELLAAAGLSLKGFDAIAFGRGPGAFTGLRLAASIAQGLAFSAELPVIPVSDLQALAQQALAQHVPAPPAARVLVCQDARMGEVYWAGYDSAAGYARPSTREAVAKPELVLEEARAWLGSGAAADVPADAAVAAPASAPAYAPTICAVGSGFAAYPALALGLAPRLGSVWADLHPRAREIAALAAHAGLASALPPEQALPVYVRNDVALVPTSTARIG
jgi:tRNA threonylcarbamoyladenosine biosynthesis protein TsaB